jgi:hypothetical protein
MLATEKSYRVVDEEGDGFGNYKLPLIDLVMFMPLLFGGAGWWSLDHLMFWSAATAKNDKGAKVKHP